jgi:hypothetical protein
MPADYLPRSKPHPIPPALALLIIRKAEQMAARFEDQALDEMTRAATRALRRGAAPEEVAQQLEL